MDKQTILIKLSAPTVFPELNQKEGFAADFARKELHIKRLKFKHFKEMNKMKPDEQMIYAISELSGLSENDIDELYAEDAGEITKTIIGFMKTFVDVAKEIMAPHKGA